MGKGKSVLALAAGAIGGTLITKYKTYEPKMERLEDEKDKYYQYYQVLNQWLSYKQEGKSLVKFFERKGYHTIAIYGMGLLGERMFDELKETAVKVQYGIDKMSDGTPQKGLPMINPGAEFEEVDCIVVSPFLDYVSIEDELYGKIQGDILGLDEVVYGLKEVD